MNRRAKDIDDGGNILVNVVAGGPNAALSVAAEFDVNPSHRLVQQPANLAVIGIVGVAGFLDPFLTDAGDQVHRQRGVLVEPCASLPQVAVERVDKVETRFAADAADEFAVVVPSKDQGAVRRVCPSTALR